MDYFDKTHNIVLAMLYLLFTIFLEYITKPSLAGHGSIELAQRCQKGTIAPLLLAAEFTNISCNLAEPATSQAPATKSSIASSEPSLDMVKRNLA